MYNFNIEFEYDIAKSQLNLEKHGISFEEAKLFWLIFTAEISARSENEERLIRVGLIDGRFYSCVFTHRNGRIRIISFRRSHTNEIKMYKEILFGEEKSKTQEDKR